MSKNLPPKFQSKIPRPVIQTTKKESTRDVKPTNIPSPVTHTVKGSFNDFKTPFKRVKSKSGANLKDDDIGHSGSQRKIWPNNKAQGAVGDEFKTDEKALQSILSSKGITPDLCGTRQSTIQSVKRSSLYYQPSPSRFSMIDSDKEFKEKMKILKERMKSLNIKCEGATPKSEKSKTPTSTSSARPVNIYHKMTSLQTKNNLTGDITPQHQKLKMFESMSLTERKEPHPKKVNFEKPCHSSSKLDWKMKSSTSSVLGKENKLNCRFKLFSSPIHEIAEHAPSPISEQKSHSASTSIQSLVSHSQLHSENNYSRQDLSNNGKSIGNQEATIVNKDSSSAETLASCSKPLESSELLPSSPSSVSSHSQSSVLTSASYTANKCAIISTPTLCTWSVRNTICTPNLEVVSEKTPKMEESVTPGLLNTNTLKAIDNVLGKPQTQTNTPSRVALKSPSLNKAPQRTPKGLHPLQSAQRGDRNSPFLCSYLKTRLESGRF